ncbi:MAG: LacI family DNA-binding transcriptional regulator [Lachnospiraceae bacterium]|nr:LacI family DNA-binding transcriptional regulator [Lachnospiraceae bacterium]
MGQVRSVKPEDIARELGVGIVSISNALKGKKGVSENLRLRVRKRRRRWGTIRGRSLPLPREGRFLSAWSLRSAM